MIAGKPVIDYVMEDLERLGDVHQVIYVTGHLKEKVEAYARAKYPFDAVVIEQKVQDGTAAPARTWTGGGGSWPPGVWALLALVTLAE